MPTLPLPTFDRRPAVATSPGIHIGCAGWSIRADRAEHFPTEGSHLARYAHTFPAVEINTSFYRPHRPSTYARWAASTPDHFRFAVKVPRTITHEAGLADATEELDAFLAEATALGPKLGPLLVQLPPSLDFDASVAGDFFAALRARFNGGVVCEPRHPTWFEPHVDRMLVDFRVARAAADPAPVPLAALPGGLRGLAYYRLHGSPRMYYSAYSPAYLDALAATLADAAREAEVWCIFDNTALGAATSDGVAILEKLGRSGQWPEPRP